MRKIFSMLSLILAGGAAGAQDIHFSQFYESSILRNPSLTGIFTGDYKVGAIYRNQWSSISKPFQTGLANVEGRIALGGDGGDFLSLGLLAYYDKAGSIDLQTIGVYPALNYNKSLGDAHHSFLSVGFTGGYIQRSFDPTKMTFNTQYQGGSFNSGNPSGERLPESRLQNWDLGAGISFNSNFMENDEITYFVGVSGYHFTRPRRSFYAENEDLRLDMKWNASAGISWHLDDQFGVQFHGNYATQGPYSELILGGLLIWERIRERTDEPTISVSGGVFYRLNDAIIPVVKLDYKRYSFSMSYDVTASKLKTASNGQGGFELTVSKTGFFHEEESRTNCPKFW